MPAMIGIVHIPISETNSVGGWETRKVLTAACAAVLGLSLSWACADPQRVPASEHLSVPVCCSSAIISGVLCDQMHYRDDDECPDSSLSTSCCIQRDKVLLQLTPCVGFDLKVLCDRNFSALQHKSFVSPLFEHYGLAGRNFSLHASGGDK